MQVRKIWDIPRSDFAEREYRRRLKEEPLSGMGEIHPDLVRYKDCFYCCFGEPRGEASVFRVPGGALRIIRSADGEHWQTVSLGEVGRRFSVAADGRLMANKYTWTPSREGESEPARSIDELSSPNPAKPVRLSVSWLSSDGLDWSGPYTHNGYNTFRWDVAWHKGFGYCLAYCGKDFAGTLYRTPDGIQWEEVARVCFPEAHRHGYEEATLAFDPKDDSVVAVVRAKPVYAIIGRASAPNYDDWKWDDALVDLEGNGKLKPAHEMLGPQMGGPKLLRLSDGRLMVAGKADASTPTANLGRNEFYWLDPERPVLTRFARFDGFMHYPGIVEHDGVLWMTCGKRGPFEVYLVKIELPG